MDRKPPSFDDNELTEEQWMGNLKLASESVQKLISGLPENVPLMTNFKGLSKGNFNVIFKDGPDVAFERMQQYSMILAIAIIRLAAKDQGSISSLGQLDDERWAQEKANAANAAEEIISRWAKETQTRSEDLFKELSKANRITGDFSQGRDISAMLLAYFMEREIVRRRGADSSTGKAFSE